MGSSGRRVKDRRLAALALAAIAGLGLSSYLTLTHFQALPLACPSGGVIDCALVTQSRYGVIAGTAVPVGMAGMAWFAVALALVALAWRGRERALTLAVALVGWSGSAVVVVLYLVYVELAVLRHVCEWCTAVHALVLVSLLLSVSRLQALALEGRPGAT